MNCLGLAIGREILPAREGGGYLTEVPGTRLPSFGSCQRDGTMGARETGGIAVTTVVGGDVDRTGVEVALGEAPSPLTKGEVLAPSVFEGTVVDDIGEDVVKDLGIVDNVPGGLVVSVISAESGYSKTLEKADPWK